MKDLLIQKARSLGIKAHTGWKESTIKEKIAEAEEKLGEENLENKVVIKEEVKSQSPLEMAMAMMLESQVKVQTTLEKINDGIQQLAKTTNELPKQSNSQTINNVEHDMEYEYLVQAREKGIDANGNPIYSMYGSTFKTEAAAREYGGKNFATVGYRIVPKGYRVSKV